jgi:hypothetical protein
MPGADVDPAGFAAFCLIFGAGEVFAGLLLFPWILRRFAVMEKVESGHSTRRTRWALGLLERFFLFLALLLNIQQSLTVFAASKAGSRLDTERQHRVKTDYFLVGNLVSVTLALLYYEFFPIARKLIFALFH